MFPLTLKKSFPFLVFAFVLVGCGASEGEDVLDTETSPVPSVVLNSDSTSVDFNETVTLSWNATDAETCSTSGFWLGNKSISGTEIVGPLTSDETFSLTCSGDGGEASVSVRVTVKPPVNSSPALSLTVSAPQVNYNDSVALSWISSNVADECLASGDWAGVKSSSGLEIVTALTADSTFVLSCTGSGGTVNSLVEVAVTPAPALPTMSLIATPDTVSFNGKTSLSWEGSNASSCIATGDWSGEKPLSGSQTIGSLTQSSNYNLSCFGNGVTADYSVTVNVIPDELPSTSLSASTLDVIYNGETTLNWNSRNADSCKASGDWSGDKAASGSETISGLTRDSSFILNCIGPGGTTADQSVSVAVATASPTMSLSASALDVIYNGETTLNWYSSNADSCAASGDWSGEKSSSGFETINGLIADSSFILNCTGPGGTTADQKVTVTVAAALPTMSLSASALDVIYNGGTTLNWNSSNADSCTASGDWSGEKAASGSETISRLTQKSSFTLHCTGPSGTTANQTVIVSLSTALPSMSFLASAPDVAYNGETTLSWNSSNAESCAASGDWSGEKAVSGSETISGLVVDSTFRLSCTGPGGAVKYSVAIKVIPDELPSTSLSASALDVIYNGETTLIWNSSNADSCAASGDWSGDKAASGSETVSNLISDSSFTLNCTGLGGTTTDQSVTVTVAAALPTMSLSASALDVTYNGETTLSWNSSNTDSCAASGDWLGEKASSGFETINGLIADSSFILNCTGPGGTTTDQSVTVTVAAALPTMSLSASALDVAYNGETTLNWNSSNADSCAASGDWSGDKAASGSETVSNLITDSSFTLDCNGAGGTAFDSIDVTVAAPAPTLTLSASLLTVSSGGSTTLSWSSSNAESCIASGDWSGEKRASGSETVNALTIESNFVLDCSAVGGSISDSVVVTVAQSSTGNALLSWTPPTQNTDNSELTDLMGYKIYYGTESGNYSEVITIESAGITAYLVENLLGATWYFAMTAYNSLNVESVRTAEVSKTIN